MSKTVTIAGILLSHHYTVSTVKCVRYGGRRGGLVRQHSVSPAYPLVVDKLLPFYLQTNSVGQLPLHKLSLVLEVNLRVHRPCYLRHLNKLGDLLQSLHTPERWEAMSPSPGSDI